MQALCVGINNYPGTDADLAGCISDANNWAAELTRRGFSITLLTDKLATKAAIVEGLRRVILDTESGQTGVFTYSGHGSWVPDLNDDEPDHRDETLCPYDIDKGMFITDDEIADMLASRKPDARIVMITDSCHSGSVFRFVGSPGVKRKIRFLPPENFLTNKEDILKARAFMRDRPAPTNKPMPGVVHMAGCRDYEYSNDTELDGKPCGAFSHYALHTLKQLPAGSSYLDWHKAIRLHLPNWEYQQTPQLNATAALRRRAAFA